MRAFSHWINTMQRCDFFHRLSAPRLGVWSLALALAAALSAPPLAAQQIPPGLGNVRNFPEAALRGKLTVVSTVDADLNSRAIRMAPGMRLFSPQNSLVMLHTVIGQSFKVNYVIEPSTGMLLTAWILTEAEAAQPRPATR
jgi:hypothetical protein